MNDLKGRLDRAADSFRSSAEGLERTLQRARRRERRRRLAAACLAILLSTGATAFAVHAFRTSSDTVPAGRIQIC